MLFKLDSGKTTFSTIHSEFYKYIFLRILNIKTWNCIQRLLYRLMNNLSRQNMKKRPNMISQSEAPEPEEIEVHKHRIDKSYLSAATEEKSLTGGTRVSLTPEKFILKKKKNIKSLDLSPFLPGNKILLNEINDNNPETTDTSQSEKYDMSHTSPDDSIAKAKDTKNTNDDDEYKEDTLKLQDGKERVDNPETSDTLRDDSVIKTTKEEEALIERLMTMSFKHHVIQSVIDIVTLCGKKMKELEK